MHAQLPQFFPYQKCIKMANQNYRKVISPGVFHFSLRKLLSQYFMKHPLLALSFLPVIVYNQTSFPADHFLSTYYMTHIDAEIL